MKDQATIAVEKEQLLRWAALKARAQQRAGRVLTWGEFLEAALGEYAARHGLAESPRVNLGPPMSEEELRQVAREIVERHGAELARVFRDRERGKRRVGTPGPATGGPS